MSNGFLSSNSSQNHICCEQCQIHDLILRRLSSTTGSRISQPAQLLNFEVWGPSLRLAQKYKAAIIQYFTHTIAQIALYKYDYTGLRDLSRNDRRNPLRKYQYSSDCKIVLFAASNTSFLGHYTVSTLKRMTCNHWEHGAPLKASIQNDCIVICSYSQIDQLLSNSELT